MKQNEEKMDDEKFKYESLDFEIVKEEWNKYIIDKDIELKTRIIILRILIDKNKPGNHLVEFSQPIFTISCPIEKMGEKNHAPKQTEYEELPSYKVKINNFEENVNLYLLKENKILIVKVLHLS